MSLTDPYPTDDAPESELVGNETGDDFTLSDAEVPGFAGMSYAMTYQVAGAELVALPSKPLPLPTWLSHTEVMMLHNALMFHDKRAYIYAADRYKHLGVVLVTVGVQIGAQTQRAECAFARRESDGFVTFCVECNDSALAALQSVGHRVLSFLARQALEEVLSMLNTRS